MEDVGVSVWFVVDVVIMLVTQVSIREPSFGLAVCHCFARVYLSLHFIQVQLAAGSASVRVDEYAF